MSSRCERPNSSSIMQNHMLRLQISDGSKSSFSMEPSQPLWRLYMRSARSTAAGPQPIPPSEYTILMFGNLRQTSPYIMPTACVWVATKLMAMPSVAGASGYLYGCHPLDWMCMQIGSSASSHSAKNGSNSPLKYDGSPRTLVSSGMH